MTPESVSAAAKALVPMSDPQLMALMFIAFAAVMWKVLDVVGRGKRK